jgi:hypothetical protein
MKTGKKITNVLMVAVVAMGMMVGVANAAPWTPADTTTDMWFDATDASTITESAGLVSQWGDKSGNLNHLTQGTGSLQPTTGANTIGGLNVITATTDWMKATRVAGKYTGEKVAVFEVLTTDSGGASCEIIDSGFAGQDYVHVGHAMFDYSGTTGYRVAPKSVFTPPAGGTPYLFSSVYDGANHISYANGTAGTTVASTGNFSWDQLWINCRVNNQTPSVSGAHKYGEIIVVVDMLPEDRQTIEGYLAWKWGLEGSLPGDHPYKSAAPAGAAATPGTLIYGK